MELTILITIISISFAFDRLLDYLNLSRLDPQLPPAAKEIYDEEKYRRSQEYYRANHRFTQITSSFSFLVFLLLLSVGGFGMLDTWIRTYISDEIWISLAFFGFLGTASGILSLPFEIYKTFVIEEKFGFNKTSVRLFVLDKLKSLLLMFILGGLLAALLLNINAAAGEFFWVLAWLVFIAVMILASTFYTSLLLPIFNKLSPLPEGELSNAIRNYCSKNGFALKDIYVMDGSKRSAKANAFFSGLGRKKKIVLFDTLIRNHSTDELLAVLAHETGHFSLKHTRTGLVWGIVQSGIMLYILSLFLGNDAFAKALGAKGSAFHLDLISFSILYTPLSTCLGIISNLLSRRHEYQADAFARRTFGAEPLVGALKKLSADNLSNLLPHPAYVFVHYSHPPLLKRIQALEKKE